MRRAFALLATALSLGAIATAAALAAQEAGTPLPVAPGVPGNGRAWELVSSEDPNSAVNLWIYQATGERMMYATIGQLPGAPVGEPLPAPAIAVRGAAGWTNASLPPPPLSSIGIADREPRAFDPALEDTIWRGPSPSGEPRLFRRAVDGTYTLLSGGATLVDASADLSHVLFRSESHLLPADAGRNQGASLYESVGSSLRLVDVDDSGALLSSCGANGGKSNSISSDGRRIFFGASLGCEGPERVYLRSEGTTTREISASQCDLSDCGPDYGASFVGATPSGSSAFLVSETRLTDGDSDSHFDLYRYDVASGDLTLLTPGSDVIPFFNLPVSASADGSRVYFSATESLGPGQGTAQRWVLADANGLRVVPGASPGLLFEISSDGRFAAFSTAASLTAADSDQSIDIYRYDAESGGTELISDAGGDYEDAAADAETSQRFEDHAGRYRVTSDDGTRIFFTTSEPLLAEDHNEVADVYGWERGDLGLVSSGAGRVGSRFAATSPDGVNVIFETSDTLLPRDRDGGDPDYYAARLGGGFPEPPPPLECGGSCGVARQARSVRPTAATAAGPGATLRLRRIGSAARRRAAESGWLTLLAEVPQPGRLAAEARARIGRPRTIAAGSTTVSQPGPARLRLRLSAAARRTLARGRDLRVRLRLRLSGLDSVQRDAFELRGKR